MPSFTIDDRLIWFAHCPKAGGTSVERLMIDCSKSGSIRHLHWGWDLWWKHGGWRTAEPPNSPQHLVWKDALDALPRAPDQVFSVVRDPLRRMQSEQRWQRVGRRGTQFGKVLAWLPFSIWLRLILAIAQRNPYAFDNHLRPQSDFIPEHAKVFRLEDGLEPVAKWFGRIAGTEASARIPHLLQTRPDRAPDPREAVLIAEIFAEDYIRFGYEFASEGRSARPILDWLSQRLSAPLAWLERRALI